MVARDPYSSPALGSGSRGIKDESLQGRWGNGEHRASISCLHINMRCITLLGGS